MSSVLMVFSPCILDDWRLQIMRTCLSFLVVEHMRNGLSPAEACRLAIQRQMAVSGDICPDDGDQRMHSSLVVGVVAMDRWGNVRA